MACKEKLGQIVVPIFYKVDPTDVKKQSADFRKGFRKTCSRKTKEDIGRWQQALEKVATVAGYHSNNWDNEAAMIENITTDVSNKLNNSTPSNDFQDLVGMGAHMEKMEQWLWQDMDEVKMIGIWGPSGIGKTTIARFLFNQHSNSFDLSVFMENIKAFMYTRPACSDDYSLKLHLQKQFMSQIIDQKDIEIPHLGVAHDRLKDRRVLVVLDDVDRSVQLDAMAKETRWFGRGSRIIITTQDRRLLRAHGIKDIYKVDFPATNEALQIFCLYAFGQKSPEDGFEELLEVTQISGNLPLALKVMGSYFRGMSKQEWTEALPRLRTHLDSDIQSILKFSYDALDDEDKDLFLHIACFFRGRLIDQTLEETHGKNFPNMRHRLRILAERSLISIDRGYVMMHNLLAQLGIEIVRKQSIHEPGHRQFLVDARDICEVLTEETGSGSVLGIRLELSEIEKELDINERAFQGMPNLQFLRIYGAICDEHTSTLSPHQKKLQFPGGLNYLPRKLKILYWEDFQLTSLPSEFHTEFLVDLFMPYSMLEKLWEGTYPLRNLRMLDLKFSKNLKELPDLSTATNLQTLDLESCSSLVELPSIGNPKRLILDGCSSLVKLPSTIGNATNLELLNLRKCSALLELPSSIGNATNLKELYLSDCISLKELPSSIGNLHKLQTLYLERCSKLEVLPININLESLDALELSGCSLLKCFPEISTNIEYLWLVGTAVEEVPSAIKSWSRLHCLEMPYSENQLPDSLLFLNAGYCESLERLDWSFHNPEICLNFGNCFKLNQEARDLIIQTPTNKLTVLPCGEVPAYFSEKANGVSVTVKLNERPLHTFLRFKACILLVDKGEHFGRMTRTGPYKIEIRQNGSVVTCRTSEFVLRPLLTENLYTFKIEAEVTSSELVFDFKFDSDKWEIRECGLLQLLEVPRD